MFQRVQPGQKLNIGAATWNAVLGATEAQQRSGHSGAGASTKQDGSWEFGKLDAAVTEGVNTGKTLTIWLGPAWDTDDAATSSQWPVHYATEALDSGTYVIATWKRGKCYVQPWECQG